MLIDKYGREIKQDSVIAVAQIWGQSAAIRKGRVIEIRTGQSIYDTRFKMSWIQTDGTTDPKATWINYASRRIILLEA